MWHKSTHFFVSIRLRAEQLSNQGLMSTWAQNFLLCTLKACLLNSPILVSNGYNDGEISVSQTGADEDSSLLGYDVMSSDKLLLMF